MRKGTIPRHQLSGIELAPQVVTAEQYEARNKGMVSVDDDTVRMLAEGVTVTGQDRNGHKRTRVMSGLGIAPWLQRTMGLRIREALGVRKSDFTTRPDGTRYLHLCWQASENGRTLEPLKHRHAGDFRDIPYPAWSGTWWRRFRTARFAPARTAPPTCRIPLPGTGSARSLEYRGISGAHTHCLRHQFASEALDAGPARAGEHQPGTRPRLG